MLTFFGESYLHIIVIIHLLTEDENLKFVCKMNTSESLGF